MTAQAVSVYETLRLQLGSPYIDSAQATTGFCMWCKRNTPKLSFSTSIIERMYTNG